MKWIFQESKKEKTLIFTLEQWHSDFIHTHFILDGKNLLQESNLPFQSMIILEQIDKKTLHKCL